MTNEEAKFILGAYRPGGRDAGDPLFAEALRQARLDPELAAWLAREQADSASFAARLNSIAPPPALREAIMTGARLSMAAAQKPRMARFAWLGIAAAVAVTAATAAFWPMTARAQVRRLAEFAVNDALLPQHGSHGQASAKLWTALNQPNNCLSSGIAVDFDALRTTGCRTVRFAGHDVVELCFSRDGVDFHFYALRRSDFPGLPKIDACEAGESEGMSYVMWTHDDMQLMVVSRAGIDAIRKLL